MKYIFILVFSIINCTFIIAQDSTKTLSPMFHVRYSATTIANNNTDNSSFVANNNLRFNFARNNIFINTMNSWVYGLQSASGLTNNDFFSSLDFNYFNKPSKLYYWGLLTYEKSYSLKIHDRFQGGFGLGYEIFYKPDLILLISNGILYEESALYESSKYEVLRNSLRLKHKVVIKNIATIEGAHFWQQALNSWDDYILKTNASASLKIKSWLSLTAALTHNKVSRTKKENLLLSVGLSFDKRF